RRAAGRAGPRCLVPRPRSVRVAAPRTARSPAPLRRTAPPRISARAGTPPRTAGAPARASPEIRAVRIPADRRAAVRRAASCADPDPVVALVRPWPLCPLVSRQRMPARIPRTSPRLVAIHPLVARRQQLFECLSVLGEPRRAGADRQRHADAGARLERISGHRALQVADPL